MSIERYIVSTSHAIDGVMVVIYDSWAFGYPVVDKVLIPSSAQVEEWLDSRYGLNWRYESV